MELLSARGWAEVHDERGVADVVREEQRLLGDLLALVARWNFLPARRDAAACRLAAPCGPGECNFTGLAMN